ncbi:hypothetical protein [Streptomyces sp. NPDC001401]|uniref:hypothetical protein n=1 Tax=Streptomyces sp. NPDC001401 TaxID=3364570 RepID=UPI0036CF4B4D
MSDRIMRYWDTFAGRGVPNGHGQPDWPAYQGGGNGIVQLARTTSRRCRTSRPNTTAPSGALLDGRSRA